ncbi:MAG: hypothetical protein BWY85_00814 [Firmicutes bacterium ADurb.Bin506]|nr:MAG: hypothetical protein BWY85_00814 [Firmicutes bacterium ADurb.Bin506]
MHLHHGARANGDSLGELQRSSGASDVHVLVGAGIVAAVPDLGHEAAEVKLAGIMCQRNALDGLAVPYLGAGLVLGQPGRTSELASEDRRDTVRRHDAHVEIQLGQDAACVGNSEHIGEQTYLSCHRNARIRLDVERQLQLVLHDRRGYIQIVVIGIRYPVERVLVEIRHRSTGYLRHRVDILEPHLVRASELHAVQLGPEVADARLVGRDISLRDLGVPLQLAHALGDGGDLLGSDRRYVAGVLVGLGLDHSQLSLEIRNPGAQCVEFLLVLILECSDGRDHQVDARFEILAQGDHGVVEAHLHLRLELQQVEIMLLGQGLEGSLPCVSLGRDGVEEAHLELCPELSQIEVVFLSKGLKRSLAGVPLGRDGIIEAHHEFGLLLKQGYLPSGFHVVEPRVVRRLHLIDGSGVHLEDLVTLRPKRGHELLVEFVGGGCIGCIELSDQFSLLFGQGLVETRLELVVSCVELTGGVDQPHVDIVELAVDNQGGIGHLVVHIAEPGVRFGRRLSRLGLNLRKPGVNSGGIGLELAVDFVAICVERLARSIDNRHAAVVNSLDQHIIVTGIDSSDDCRFPVSDGLLKVSPEVGQQDVAVNVRCDNRVVERHHHFGLLLEQGQLDLGIEFCQGSLARRSLLSGVNS